MTSATTSDTPSLSRREFLYYIWGASLALFTAQFTGLLIWFLLPRFREGQFGGTFTISAAQVSPVNAPPVNFPDGRFWLVNLDTTNPQGQERMVQAPDEAEPIIGVAAVYKVCTHLGCIYAWVPANDRFECPCHGSKYRLDGRRIVAPAPRTLDRFPVIALDGQGNELARSGLKDNFWEPLLLPQGTTALRIDTGAIKQGPGQTLLCSFVGNCP
ncbi:MAG: Rieske 2Fe-2S domain-containing protein [Chloroflexota bacterium]